MAKFRQSAAIAPAAALAGLGVVSLLRLRAASKETDQNQERVSRHLATFDDLDFNVFSNQKWNEFDRSHSRDIVVYWPDGHTTMGIEKHIDDLKTMFTYAPDLKVTSHPIKIGQGDWTAVTGVMEGTFTRPMRTADGRTIRPTNKSFKLNMATIGHWNADDVMDEEHLFWDNADLTRQLEI